MSINSLLHIIVKINKPFENEIYLTKKPGTYIHTKNSYIRSFYDTYCAANQAVNFVLDRILF